MVAVLPRTRPYSEFHYETYCLLALVGASTTSHLGSAIGRIALPLTALNVLHASALEMGLITAAGYLAYLLISLPAGVSCSACRCAARRSPWT